ncbi:uncharacterized protein C8Q71DRAFT_58374 [Rhodofomes roseus]|uniref:Uncharacterized protein n=1 Tax=Rhodofomes roseus TaxID=34475 RepID=A0ABQ8KG59_9APHY|nr:uncharacterized protein C8Q71DRAFT_58374 [Rhodofomes roseus]KAH9836768.1 hypothetical protein C8Q71DRAFT_58374 [Rhodofomes roseus]
MREDVVRADVAMSCGGVRGIKQNTVGEAVRRSWKVAFSGKWAQPQAHRARARTSHRGRRDWPNGFMRSTAILISRTDTRSGQSDCRCCPGRDPCAASCHHAWRCASARVQSLAQIKLRCGFFLLFCFRSLQIVGVSDSSGQRRCACLKPYPGMVARKGHIYPGRRAIICNGRHSTRRALRDEAAEFFLDRQNTSRVRRQDAGSISKWLGRRS